MKKKKIMTFRKPENNVIVIKMTPELIEECIGHAIDKIDRPVSRAVNCN